MLPLLIAIAQIQGPPSPLYPLNASPRIEYSVSPAAMTAIAGSINNATVITTTDKDTYRRLKSANPDVYEDVIVDSSYHLAAPAASPINEIPSYTGGTFTQSAYAGGTFTYAHVKRVRSLDKDGNPITTPVVFIDRYLATDNAGPNLILIRDKNIDKNSYSFDFAQSVTATPAP